MLMYTRTPEFRAHASAVEDAVRAHPGASMLDVTLALRAQTGHMHRYRRSVVEACHILFDHRRIACGYTGGPCVRLRHKACPCALYLPADVPSPLLVAPPRVQTRLPPTLGVGLLIRWIGASAANRAAISDLMTNRELHALTGRRRAPSGIERLALHQLCGIDPEAWSTPC